MQGGRVQTVLTDAMGRGQEAGYGLLPDSDDINKKQQKRSRINCGMKNDATSGENGHNRFCGASVRGGARNKKHSRYFVLLCMRLASP